ncbi:MAG: FAD-dependent oxidoreductase [Christensenellaceae bacterium]|jgi:3-oxosteroid 1-dehydrogenase
MKKWECKRCGYVHDGDAPPENCPVCGAPKELFVLIDEDAGASNQAVYEKEADVIVVGSGAAAFVAAVTARKEGASVIMLEKASDIGGTTARSGGGFWAPGNRWQEALGYQDDREACIAYMVRYSYPNLYNNEAPRYGIPAREYSLIETYVDTAKEMVSFLQDIGALNVIEEINWTGKPQVDYMEHLPENKAIRGRTLYPKNDAGEIVQSGAEMIQQLAAWAEEKGIQILTNCMVTSIVQDEAGKVTGVEANYNDALISFQAKKGVIFGSGGYSHNKDLMLQWQRGPHYGGCSVPTNTGDFVRLAGTIGAQMGNTAGAFRAQSMIEAYLANPGGSSNVFYLPGDSMLLINKYGKRFVNEKRNYTDRTMLHFVWDPVKAEWTNMLTFMLFDTRTATLWQGYPPFPVQGEEMPYLIKGDTLEELEENLSARLAKLAPHTGAFALDETFLASLKDTLKTYNGYAKSGKDEDFARGDQIYDREFTTFPPTVPGAEWPPADSKNITMYPLSETGPYYALILAAGTLDTNGGPVADAHGRILDWDNAPIEGLYGAGNCIASPTANAYWGAGSTLGPAMTFGYLSAKHCVKHL